MGASVLIFLLSSPAFAQGGGQAVERAREHFAAGTECMQEDDWGCAEARFRAALDLHPAATIRYNLASVLYEQGRYAESARLAQEVLDDPEADRVILDHALTLREQVRENGSVARVLADDVPDDAELRVDGYLVPSNEWAEVPVAVGPHQFSLHRDGELLTETTVEVTAGTPVDVPLVLVDSPASTADGGPSDLDGLLEDPVFWGVAAGAGVAVVVAVIVIVAVAVGGGVEGPIDGDFEPGVLRW